MKLLVTRKNGETQLLDLALPVRMPSAHEPQSNMWVIQDAQGTDYYFNADDGTYDGWGRAVTSQAEAAQLLNHAQNSTAPPKETTH